MAKENINLISKKCKEDWLLQSFYVQAMPDFFFFSPIFNHGWKYSKKALFQAQERMPYQWWLYCLEENRVLLVVSIFLCTYWLFV